MGVRARNALEAVEAGVVKHAHPFTWGVDAPYLSLGPRTFQRLAREGLIRVEANAEGYWRPVHLTDKGRAALAKARGEA